MDKFNATQEQKDEIKEIYEKIKNKSSFLRRARPQSTSSGLVYWYILKNNKNVTIQEFTKKVGLSKLTIERIVKEINNILDNK